MNRQFASFRLDGALWGVNILQIREVIKNFTYFHVPKSSNYVLGLINLRGQIVTILDLSTRISRKEGTPEKRDACIILKTDNELNAFVNESENICMTGVDVVGLQVDEMGEVIAVEEDMIDSSPAHVSDDESRSIQGVVKLDNELMLILDLDPVLTDLQ